jgi:flagellar FliL protein
MPQTAVFRKPDLIFSRQVRRQIVDSPSIEGNPMQSRTHLILLLLCFTTSLFAADGVDEAETLIYYEVKPSLVANLASGGKYIRTDIQLMTKDPQFQAQLELHGPAIRHTLLMLLSEQDGRSIRTPEGKENLRQHALAQLSSLMQEMSGQTGPDALFFTTFLVQ